MPEVSLVNLLQISVSLGLLNVWLIRAPSETRYRGGEAKTLREEFSAYGLPGWMFYVVGALKVGAAVVLLVGLWVPGLALPAAAVVALLMVGAIAMHVKVKDTARKSMPAFVVLVMTATICALSLPV